MNLCKLKLHKWSKWSATISTTGRDIARYVENCRADLRRIGAKV
jgi:hypothetical protein